MDQAGWIKSSYILALVAGGLSLWQYDWMSLLVVSFYVFTALYVHTKSNLRYSLKFYNIICVCLLSMACVLAVKISGTLGSHLLGGQTIPDLIGYVLEPITVFTIGMMVALAVDRMTETVLSKRWMIMLAVGIAFAVSMVEMFSLAIDLWYTCQPFFPGSSESFRGSNLKLMLSCDIAAFTILFSAIICRWAMNGIKKEDLVEDIGP